MSVETSPGFLQGLTYSAEITRRSITYLLQRGASIGSVTGGLVAASDCQTTAGAGMQVSTAPGEMIVPQGFSATGGGVYCRVASTTTSSAPASDPTNPRVDLLVGQVDDAAYSGALNDYRLSYLTGTPTAGTTLVTKAGAPALPTSALALSYILIPAGSSSTSNGNILNVATQAQLGLNPFRGATNIATSQSTSSTSFTTLATPDQVTGIVLPTNGLIVVGYQATWQESVAGAASAAVFIGANQLKIAVGSTGPVQANTQAAITNASGTGINHDQILASSAIGLVSAGRGSGGASYAGDVTTGQIVGASADASNSYLAYTNGISNVITSNVGTSLGGPCYVFAAAGTYTVSVQFKASSGSVTTSNRKLWVQALTFS